MIPTRFDTISKILASRRTRRDAIAGGLGLTAAALGTRSLAQVATPSPLPDEPHPSADDAAHDPMFLFVQPFNSGTWAPKTGEEDVYTLTLAGAAAQTVYFSDRPERIVGLSPTQQFLDGLGFTPANPPNAAIVAQRESGDDQEILVIELLNPVYDADAATLTYDARVLADYGEHGLAHLARQQQDYELGEVFGSGSLFIDDCSDLSYSCVDNGSGAYYGHVAVPYCWSADANGCVPCGDPDNACLSQMFPSCRKTQADIDGQNYYTNVCHAVSDF